MWWALFGYSGSVAAALMARLVVLLAAGPWLILLGASASGGRSRRAMVVRAILVVLLLDRMIADFQMWGPIAAALAVLWPLAPGWTAKGESRRGAIRPATVVWLIAGSSLVVLAANLGTLARIPYVAGLIRGAVLFFVLSGLVAGWPRAAPPCTDSEAPEHAGRAERPRGWWIGPACLCLIATILLYWSIPEFTRGIFPLMLLVGLLGWTGVQFLCWRAARTAGRWRLGVRAASWLCGVTAGVLFAVLATELYFRYVYDASDSNANLRTAGHWRQRHVHLNSWGYRDREFPAADQLAGMTRIVLLGDSFAFGWGIADEADMLGPRLEHELAGRISPPPRVFTLAIGGIDTRRETRLFKQDGVRLSPRVVVLQYHLNDTDTLVRRPLPPWTASPGWWPITDNSDFLEFFLYHAFLRCQAGHMTVMDLPGLAAYQDPVVFARQSRDLLALMAMIRKGGAAPVAVLYPYLSAPTQDGPQRYALDRVIEVLAGAGVPVVDVSRIVDVNDRRFHANPFDPHPSPALNAAVVPALSAAVLKAMKVAAASAPATQPVVGVVARNGAGSQPKRRP